MDVMGLRRAILQASEDVLLPSGYRRISYIESTEAQYIDTQITPTLNTKAHIVFCPTIMSNGIGYFGSRNDPLRFCCTTFSSGAQIGLNVSSNTWTSNRVPLILNTLYDCEIENGRSRINSNIFSETPLTSDKWSYGVGRFVLAAKDAYNRVQNTSAKWYLCEMWENGSMILKLIPCIRISDNKPGMYDLVNDTLYTNAGSGEFVVPS